jgi:hypothetical protein
MNPALKTALARLDKAIDDPGPRPYWHHRQVQELKKNWPVLWNAIEEVRKEAARSE